MPAVSTPTSTPAGASPPPAPPPANTPVSSPSAGAGRPASVQAISSGSPPASPSRSPTSNRPRPSSTKRVKGSTTITHGSSSTVIPLISHDKPSHGTPTGAIVAAVVVSTIVLIAILFQLWRWRSRRQARSTAAIPPPPPRAAAFVQSIYGHSAIGGTARNEPAGLRSGAVNAASESDEESYDKSPLQPPVMRNERPASWITFEGKPSTANINGSSSHMPMLEHGSRDPFASDSEVSLARHRGATDSTTKMTKPVSGASSTGGQGHGPRNHGDDGQEAGTGPSPVNPNLARLRQDDAEVSPGMDPAAVAAVMRYSFGEESPGPLPGYPSLTPNNGSSDDESSGVSPDRQPRSPPPKSLPQHRVVPSSSSNSDNSSSSHSPARPTNSTTAADRRTSLGSNSRSASRLHSMYIPPIPGPSGTTIRGAPHLPHVRAGVEIVLPTPLAPQMHGVQVQQSQSISNVDPYGSTGTARTQRSASRTSIGSIKTDTWADAMLSARHQPVPTSTPDAAGGESDAEGSKDRRGRRKEKRGGNRSRSASRAGSQSRPTSPTMLDGQDSIPLSAPKRPWDASGSGSRSDSEARDSIRSAAPSSWKSSPHASTYALDA